MTDPQQDETVEQWATREIAAAELTPEYWQERYEIERGEVLALKRTIAEARKLLRRYKLGTAYLSEAEEALRGGPGGQGR